MTMLLGIEIGGTKLQLGVGEGREETIVELVRHDVDARRGAAGILKQIEQSGDWLLQKYVIDRIGIGFGGPVDSAVGVVTKSHQVGGWENFPLVRWCHEKLARPAVLGNDCDAAALAEGRFGAGRGAGSVFYVTVGTGIGGGLVVNGRLHGVGRPAAAEIGHLRPGFAADRPDKTVESLASGPAIAAAAMAMMTTSQDSPKLTAQIVAQMAARGDLRAGQVLANACQALGWAIGQVITLVAPEIVVIGGGVSLMSEELFFAPLRAEVARYVFPPLASSFRIVPAGLGELAVVHGALALAADKAA
jgi:glucokinase